MIDVENLTKRQLASYLDSTYLKPFGAPEIIDNLCREAAEYGFASVAVNGDEVAKCASLLKGTGVKVTAVAGFPLGQMSMDAKIYEVRDVLAAANQTMADQIKEETDKLLDTVLYITSMKMKNGFNRSDN